MPRNHTIEAQRLTPLGRLIAEYMRSNWIPNVATLAKQIGIRPGTVKSLLYDQRDHSSRTLHKVAERTGIPATLVYEAASGHYRPAPPIAPPSRDPEAAYRPRRIATPTGSDAHKLQVLEQYIRQVQTFSEPEEVKQAYIAGMAHALGIPIPLQPQWAQRFQEEHDWTAIETLEVPAVPGGTIVANDERSTLSQSEKATSRN